MAMTFVPHCSLWFPKMAAFTFNANQEDTLKELINVSFGVAASLIGDLLESHAKLHIPEISTIAIQDFDAKIIELLGIEEQFYLTKQRFIGSFNGEVIFIFTPTCATSFCNLLLKSDERLSESDTKSSILELTNIITSACISQLCELINGQTVFQVPSIEKRERAFLDDYEKIVGYDNVIVIKTALDIEQKNILGHMFILLNNRMLEHLQYIMEGL